MEEDQIRPTIFSDSEFTAYGVKMDERIYIAGNVQIIVILLFDFFIRYKSGIFRICFNLLVKSRHDSINVLFP